MRNMEKPGANAPGFLSAMAFGAALFCFAESIRKPFRQTQNVIGRNAVKRTQRLKMPYGDIDLPGLESSVHGPANAQKIRELLLRQIPVLPEASENFISFHIITMLMVTEDGKIC